MSRYQPPTEARRTLSVTHFRVLSRTGRGIEVKGGNTVGQPLGRKFKENI